jgi:hypothetical protein
MEIMNFGSGGGLGGVNKEPYRVIAPNLRDKHTNSATTLDIGFV